MTDEEIEKMAKVICPWGQCKDCPCKPKDRSCVPCKPKDRSCIWVVEVRKLQNTGYGNVKKAVKETAKECLKILHNIGGCDATDEFSKGWDKAIDTAYVEISDKYEVEE